MSHWKAGSNKATRRSLRPHRDPRDLEPTGHRSKQPSGVRLTERTAAIAEKTREARRLLRRVPNREAYARLLHMANVRMDETLIDALLAELTRLSE